MIEKQPPRDENIKNDRRFGQPDNMTAPDIQIMVSGYLFLLGARSPIVTLASLIFHTTFREYKSDTPVPRGLSFTFSFIRFMGKTSFRNFFIIEL